MSIVVLNLKNGLKMKFYNDHPILYCDKYLIFTILALISISLVMVTSASMAISERIYDAPFHFLFRQAMYVFLGLFVGNIILQVKMEHWFRISAPVFLISIFLLMLVLIPHIGHSVNGSRRWIGFGPLGLQVSEFAKLSVVIFMASYIVRHAEEVNTKISGVAKPLVLLSFMALLLLMEPDFGATVVIFITALSMLFLGGMRLKEFGILLLIVLVAMTILAISSPYRMARLTGFLHPWQNQFSSGYQLTQSLIAFGRGGFFGVGLGGSIQKLFYLPEAHTDFLFAVIGEETGLVGILLMMGLYVLLFIRTILVGRRAQLAGDHAAGFVAYGFSVWWMVQAIVNMGVNAGILPTKGLTLPFISYGGSSLLILFMAVAILLRIDYEVKVQDVANRAVGSGKHYRVR
jgi:cell division protein FtsW